MHSAKTLGHFGAITGAAVIRLGDAEHDLRHEIWADSHTNRQSGVHITNHGAHFILLVEKRQFFDRLVEDRFARDCPCLLATGNGYPSRHFRALLRDVQSQWQIPLYILADNDPAGYLLFFLMARGTSRLVGPMKIAEAVPTARFLGLRSADFERLSLSRSATIDLGPSELSELERLRTCPWLKSDPDWDAELDLMHRHSFKIELEAMCSIGTGLLAKEYLPERVGSREYLELLP